MRWRASICALIALAACGGDVASDRTAAVSAENAAARDAAQAGRFDNPEALACLRANASDEEWSAIQREDAEGEASLQAVIDRESTARCFNDNNVVIYL